ncbi:fumarylacetoacetate hydrolase family protein [Isosphaeraceae bacterium EP7]
MKLARFRTKSDPSPRVGIVEESVVRPLAPDAGRLADVLHSDDPASYARAHVPAGVTLSLDQVELLAPIDDQEVWGAGVTYERSKIAREEESEKAASFYDLVYRAPRPELFFKANARRVIGHDQAIRVRSDSRWSVPEPELALVLSPTMRLVGFTIGNDVSARDIEGENPLYLPQAKVHDACCGLGPVITLAEGMPAVAEIGIRLEIERAGAIVVQSETSAAKMKRTFDELIGWLSRDNAFPDGAILLTGTGVVPPDEFGLTPGDIIRMSIDGIGTLRNTVVQSSPTSATQL